MTALFIKDIIVLKKYAGLMIIIALFYCIIGFFSNQSDPSFFGGFISIMFVLLTLTAFSFDDAAKWNSYALTLPLRKKDIVAGKYLLAVTTVIFGGLISVVNTTLINLVNNIPITFGSYTICFIFIGISSVFVSILYPIVIKYGVEKSRIMMFLLIFLPVGAVALIEKAFPDFKISISESLQQTLEQILPFAAPILILLILYCSYCISIRIFLKKEH